MLDHLFSGVLVFSNHQLDVIGHDGACVAGVAVSSDDFCENFGEEEGLCAIELRQYIILFVQFPLYELVPEGLLRALQILKPH